MLSEDDDILSVTLSVNEECPSDTRYPVLVTFGIQLADGVCVGEINATVMTISPGDSPVTFSVDANTLEDNEVYCYIASISGTIGECVYISGIIITTSKHIVIIVIIDTGEEDDFPLGLVVGVSVAGVVIIATLIGAIIVVIVVVWYKRKKKEKNEVIYEEPDVKIDTDIPLSDNQAYGHVNMQRMRN